MEEIVENKYCNHCKKVTGHLVREDGIEIEFICNECNEEQHIIKTFF